MRVRPAGCRALSWANEGSASRHRTAIHRFSLVPHFDPADHCRYGGLRVAGHLSASFFSLIQACRVSTESGGEE
jgi:hypothetical protein